MLWQQQQKGGFFKAIDKTEMKWRVGVMMPALLQPEPSMTNAARTEGRNTVNTTKRARVKMNDFIAAIDSNVRFQSV